MHRKTVVDAFREAPARYRDDVEFMMRTTAGLAKRLDDSAPGAVEAQAILAAAVTSRFPDDDLLVAGAGASPRPVGGDAGCRCGERHGPRTWLPGPIDGLAHYAVYGALCTIPLTLVEAGRPEIAVVFNPPDRMYWAIAGEGAWLNRGRLTLASPAPIACASGIHDELVGHGGRVSRPVAGISICKIADRQALAGHFPRASEHLLAATGLILLEAGGTIDWERRLFSSGAIASAPALAS